MRVKQLFVLALLIGALCACAATDSYRRSRPLGLGPFPELTLALQNNPATKGMVLAGQGRTNALLNNETAWVGVDFSYSLYGNPGVEDKNGEKTAGQPAGEALVNRHFHMVQGFFGSGSMTRFAVGNRNERTDLSLQTLRRNGLWCVERVRFVRSDSDWFSQLWLDQGRVVPEQWIAKRYTFTIVNRQDRFVYEYREPYPECMPPTDDLSRLRLGILSDRAQSCLAQFNMRADAFVEFDPSATENAIPHILSTPQTFEAAPVPKAVPVMSDSGVNPVESPTDPNAAPRRRLLLDPVSILGDVERIERDDFFR